MGLVLGGVLEGILLKVLSDNWTVTLLEFCDRCFVNMSCHLIRLKYSRTCFIIIL